MPDEDGYQSILALLLKTDLTPPDSVDRYQWVCLRANLYLIDYYMNEINVLDKKITCTKGQDLRKEYKQRLFLLKALYSILYIKMVQKHTVFFGDIFINKYCLSGKHAFKNLFCPLFESEEFTFEFLMINITAEDPAKKLVFCFRELLDGWDSGKIVDFLSGVKLNDIFIMFINEYSKQSNIPQVFILQYFRPLESSLEDTKAGVTLLESFFPSKDRDKRVDLVGKWWERLKDRLIKESIKIIERVLINKKEVQNLRLKFLL